MSGFDLRGRVAVVTGGTGVLGGAMSRALAAAGARVAVLGRREEVAERVARELGDAGAEAMALPADVLDADGLRDARTRLEEAWGPAHVLVNAAGGNRPDALVHGDQTLFDLTPEAFRAVVDLNLTGTLLPIQAFGEGMAREKRGSIVNISSMAARKPLTRVIGYAAAKAAVDNLTQWLAVHAARTWGEKVRVNAIAPGFFLGDQNRAMLMNDDGTPTDRGQTILNHTPMGRFGDPDDLAGTITWLASDASRFVTGVVIPIDGGYDAFGGV
ncbi:MAG: SDR family oxidoreductase [Trueperaceae bacterium]|nr:SDR family oxidoreductase [Trueperaceae bacterium]